MILTKRVIKKNIYKSNSEEIYGYKIDFLIKDIIDILNKKGYITVYSCSGHFKKHKRFYDKPYIVFSNYSKKIVDAPKNWYILDNYDEKFITQANPILGETIEACKPFTRKTKIKDVQLCLKSLKKMGGTIIERLTTALYL